MSCFNIEAMLQNAARLEVAAIPVCKVKPVNTIVALYDIPKTIEAVKIAAFTQDEVRYTIVDGEISTYSQSMFFSKGGLHTVEFVMTEAYLKKKRLYGFTNIADVIEADFTNINLSNKVEANYAFMGCPKLQAVIWGQNYRPVYCDSMFKGCTSFSDIESLKNLFERCVEARYLFADCTSITEVNFKELGFGNSGEPVSLSAIFRYCSGLVYVECAYLRSDLIVTSCDFMFDGCLKLADAWLGSLNIKNCWSLKSMFNGCQALKGLDFGEQTLKGSAVESRVADRMFYGCKSLTSFDMSFFEGSKITNAESMFATSGICEINLTNIMRSAVYADEICYDCFKLRKVCFTEHLMYLQPDVSLVKAFSRCSALETFNVVMDEPSSLEEPEYLLDIQSANMEDMFYQCLRLKSASFEKIRLTNCHLVEAFKFCKKLTNITLLCNNKTALISAFHNCGALEMVRIYVTPTNTFDSGYYDGIFDGIAANTHTLRIFLSNSSLLQEHIHQLYWGFFSYYGETSRAFVAGLYDFRAGENWLVSDDYTGRDDEWRTLVKGMEYTRLERSYTVAADENNVPVVFYYEFTTLEDKTLFNNMFKGMNDWYSPKKVIVYLGSPNNKLVQLNNFIADNYTGELTLMADKSYTPNYNMSNMAQNNHALRDITIRDCAISSANNIFDMSRVDKVTFIDVNMAHTNFTGQDDIVDATLVRSIVTADGSSLINPTMAGTLRLDNTDPDGPYRGLIEIAENAGWTIEYVDPAYIP